MCLQGLGRRDESERVVHLALDIAERLGDAALLARVHRALLLLYVWTGPPQLARKHGARAIVLAEQSSQRGVEWSAHWALAMLGGLTASVEDISHHLAEAQRLADELRSPLLRAWTAEVAIEYYAGIGEWETAVSLAERTLAVARSLGQTTLIPRLLVWLALLYFGRGNVEGGKACVDEAWELSGAGRETGRGDVHSIVPAHTARAAYHLTMQDYETAIRVGERGLEVADASGYVVWAVHRLMPVIAEAALWKSDMKRALRVGQRLRRDAGRLDHRLGLAWADASEALAELLQGNKSRSVEMLRTVAEQLEAIPYVPDAARVRRQLARALAETGDREGATRELRRAHEVFARLGAGAQGDARADARARCAASGAFARRGCGGPNGSRARDRAAGRGPPIQQGNRHEPRYLSADRQHASLEHLREARRNLAGRAGGLRAHVGATKRYVREAVHRSPHVSSHTAPPQHGMTSRTSSCYPFSSLTLPEPLSIRIWPRPSPIRPTT
jgi:tetratricopeptide (TPR) repeat protein